MFRRGILSRVLDSPGEHVPGPLIREIHDHISEDVVVCTIADELEKTLPNLKESNKILKCLRLISYLLENGPESFKYRIKMNTTPLKNLVNYRGISDPLIGETLNKKVRYHATSCLELLYQESHNNNNNNKDYSFDCTRNDDYNYNGDTHNPYVRPSPHITSLSSPQIKVKSFVSTISEGVSSGVSSIVDIWKRNVNKGTSMKFSSNNGNKTAECIDSSFEKQRKIKDKDDRLSFSYSNNFQGITNSQQFENSNFINGIAIDTSTDNSKEISKIRSNAIHYSYSNGKQIDGNLINKEMCRSYVIRLTTWKNKNSIVKPFKPLLDEFIHLCHSNNIKNYPLEIPYSVCNILTEILKRNDRWQTKLLCILVTSAILDSFDSDRHKLDETEKENVNLYYSFLEAFISVLVPLNGIQILPMECQSQFTFLVDRINYLFDEMKVKVKVKVKGEWKVKG